MSGNNVLEDHTVIIYGSRIESIGPSESISIPTDAFLIDGAGLTLMPGLADMHAHYEEEEIGPLFVVNGVTTVRNMWGTGDQFSYDARAKAGDLVGPNVYTTGPLTDGPDPYHEGSVVIDSPEVAVTTVDAQFAEGYRDIKLYEKLTADVYKAAVGAAKENGMRIASHTPIAMQVEDLLEMRITSIEHLDGYGEALSRGQFDASAFSPVQLFTESWKHIDEASLEPLARMTAEANVWNIPTLTYYSDQLRYASDAENFFLRNEIRYVTPGIIRYWKGMLESTGSRLPQRLARYQAGDEARAGLVKILYDAGAPLLVGTDTPNPFLVPGYSYHDELYNLSQTGIPNDAILRMATSEAARFFDEEGASGIVTVGARADLILIDGDPLEDLSVLREPVGVMVNGHWRTREQIIETLEYNASQFDIPLSDKIYFWFYSIYRRFF